MEKPDRVQFRKFTDNGDIIAILPDAPANRNYYLSYMHIGQHGECSANLASFTKPATAEEAAPLFRELQQIGYNLRTIRRINH